MAGRVESWKAQNLTRSRPESPRVSSPGVVAWMSRTFTVGESKQQRVYPLPRKEGQMMQRINADSKTAGYSLWIRGLGRLEQKPNRLPDAGGGSLMSASCRVCDLLVSGPASRRPKCQELKNSMAHAGDLCHLREAGIIIWGEDLIERSNVSSTRS